jgi:hypothetical protein
MKITAIKTAVAEANFDWTFVHVLQSASLPVRIETGLLTNNPALSGAVAGSPRGNPAGRATGQRGMVMGRNLCRVATLLIFFISISIAPSFGQYAAQHIGDTVRLTDQKHQTQVSIAPSAGDIVDCTPKLRHAEFR